MLSLRQRHEAIPSSSRTPEVDPYVSGSRKFTVDCVDCMQRSYADKQPDIATEWTKWRDAVGPQSDTAIDYIAEESLYIHV